MALPRPHPDRTSIVTGASSGIGVEVAKNLAARGHGLTLVARREERLRELATELHAAHGVRVEVMPVDLSDAAARARIPLEIAARGLAADVLVNNAGFSTTGAVHSSDHAREVLMVRTNVEAVADLCSLFLPGMVDRNQGAVLNVASTAAFQPLPGQAAYGASKAFVLSYTLALRGELKGTGVTATALCPGPVHTGFVEAAGFDAAEAESSMPKFMWIDVSAVAEAAVDGLASGRAVVIPGAANRVAAAAGRFAPRSLLVPLLARQHPSLRRP